MGTDKVRVKVELVGRRDVDKQGGKFTAEVSRAWQIAQEKWLTIVQMQGDSVLVKDICLDYYIIHFITMYDEQYKDGYTEQYSSNEYDQIQAFECLDCICTEEEVVTSISQIKEVEDDIVSGLAGPKRIEITLRVHGGIGIQETRLVVLDVMPPTGRYKYYSVQGREWKVYQKKLEKAPTTAWSPSKWLTRIDAYLGGGKGSATESFTPQTQEKAWGTLERIFRKFKQSELQAIRGWDVDEDGDEEYDNICGYGGEYYGPSGRSQHWTNTAPSYYSVAPQKAHYRVAGDEIGAVLYREQRKAWEGEGSPDPEQSLKEMLEAKAEKKTEAGDSSATGGSSGGDAATSSSRCPDCGGDGCHPSYCSEDFNIPGFGGVVADGRYTVH